MHAPLQSTMSRRRMNQGFASPQAITASDVALAPASDVASTQPVGALPAASLRMSPTGVQPGLWAGLPIPLFLIGILVLWIADPRQTFQSDRLLLLLNLVFLTFASFLVACLVACSLLVRGTPGLLLLGCGALLWGCTSLVINTVPAGEINTRIAIYNLSACLSALCHLLGAVFSLRPQKALRGPKIWLPTAYAVTMIVAILIPIAVDADWIPPFFIPGQGLTPLRSTVLGTAIGMFLITAVLLRMASRRSFLTFARWYGYALALVAVGLFGAPTPVHNSLLSWAGRASQYLGGLYMLIAAMVSVRDARVWGVSLEGALRESEERLRRLGDNLPDSALYQYVYEPDGSIRFLYYSAGIERLNGVSACEVMADPRILLRQVLPEYRQQLLDAEARSAREMSDFDMELPVRRPDGQVRWMRLHSRPRRLPNGCVVWDGVQIDVTERRQAEEALREANAFLDSVLNNTHMLVASMDPDFNFRMVNRAYAQADGKEPAFFTGKNHFDLYPNAENEAIFRRVVQTGEPYVAYAKPFQYAGHPGRGVSYWDWSLIPIRGADGTITGLVLTLADVTARKRAEESLREAKAAAEEASRAKDQFLATLSHELRTPLTPVLMLSQLLQQEPGLPADIREDLKTIWHNVQLEARLIDDLLDLTRVTRGKLQLKPEIVDVHDLIEHAMLTCCDEECVRKRLKLTHELHATSPTVWADPTRLEQVLWNLIRNAIKFTPVDGRITVRTADCEGGRLRVEVADTGQGIDPARLNAIFNPFEQEGLEIARQFGGLGLGLAISKAIIDLHGGTIEATSYGRGQGTTFIVTLAIAAGAQDASVSAADSDAEQQPDRASTHRILLVEDHLPTAKVLQRLVKLWGWEVHWAPSVHKALELAARHTFHLVISDLGLPDGSGHDLMRQLRNAYGLSGIAVSGYGMEDDVQKSLAAGFARHFTKPINFEELKAATADLLATAAPGPSSER